MLCLYLCKETSGSLNISLKEINETHLIDHLQRIVIFCVIEINLLLFVTMHMYNKIKDHNTSVK